MLVKQQLHAYPGGQKQYSKGKKINNNKKKIKALLKSYILHRCRMRGENEFWKSSDGGDGEKGREWSRQGTTT